MSDDNKARGNPRTFRWAEITVAISTVATLSGTSAYALLGENVFLRTIALATLTFLVGLGAWVAFAQARRRAAEEDRLREGSLLEQARLRIERETLQAREAKRRTYTRSRYQADSVEAPPRTKLR